MRTEPGSIWCDGVIVVHDDRAYTCTEFDCDASESRIIALSRHSSFLACRDVLGDACPVCHLVRQYHLVATVDTAPGDERS
jgi:hypothetical protein